MVESIFTTGSPYVGVDESTRRALAQLNLDHQEVRRVKAACDSLGLKTVPRVHKHNVAAHLGIPDKKVAIIVRKTVETAFHEQNYRKWKEHGWELLIVTHRQTQLVTDEQLADHLRSALKSLGKLK